MSKQYVHIVYECPFIDHDSFECMGGRIHGVYDTHQEALEASRKVCNKIISEGYYDEDNPTHGHMAVLKFSIQGTIIVDLTKRIASYLIKDLYDKDVI